MPCRRVLFFGRFKREQSLMDVVEAAECLRREGAEVALHESIKAYADADTRAAFAAREIAVISHVKAFKPDLVVVLGGDGTFLGAGRIFAPLGTRLVGVNLGYLGFLTDIARERMREALSEICQGDYEEESRFMLSVAVGGKRLAGEFGCAVNDVVISRGRAGVMSRLHIHIGDRFIYDIRADGLIVATPSGSTAYALAAGGPIVAPPLEVMLLVPLCPHSLTHRPLVVPADETVRIDIGGEKQSAILHVDGNYDRLLKSGDALEIGRHPVPLRICHPRSYDYYETLRRKLNWGG